MNAEQLLKHICAESDQDMRIKAAWMEINFQGQLQAARKMRIAMENSDPSIRLGLMNSGEPSHSIQGRDMDQLLREFSGTQRRPLSRPAGSSYKDSIHDELFRMHQAMALSMNVIGDDVQITSEVENWPHTRFTKSIKTTRTQFEMHALAGAEDFTLNLYDYLATPYDQEPDFCKLLIAEKERLAN